MEDNDQQISKYSTGVNINIRIDQLWKDSHLHSRNGLYDAWNLDLDCIWSELARDFGDKEDKKKGILTYNQLKEKFDEFDARILEQGVISDKRPEGFKDLSEKQIEARNKHYKILREKQLFLARLENKLGKGTTYDTGDDDEVD